MHPAPDDRVMLLNNGPEILARKCRLAARAAARPAMRALLFALVLTGTVGPVHALEAGPLQWVQAAGGTPAHAVLELRDAAAIDATAVRARVAAREAYAVAGLDYHLALADIQVSARPLPDGRVQLRLDRLPANRPRLDLLLSLSDRRRMTLVGYRVDRRAGAETFAPIDESPQAAARRALQAWADAWSRRDVEAYLAAYAPTFAGRKGHASREAWMAERRERILTRPSISVGVTAVEARLVDGQIEARFEQRYRSEGLADVSRKRVRLVLIDGRWRIAQEDDLP